MYLRGLRRPQTAHDDENRVVGRCRRHPLSTIVVLVHQGSPWPERGNDHDAPLQQPGTRRGARLPAGDAEGTGPRHPHPARQLAAQPSAGALSAPAVPAGTGSVLSQVRATIDDVPRWDDAPLVGRADELARLLAHVERAESGRSTAVLLAGDAGVGKTRLLDELTTRAAARGVRVLTGHCVDLGDVGLPYLPFVDLLRPVAAEPSLAPQSAAEPALAGLLAGRPGVQPVVPQPGEGRDLGRPLPNRPAPHAVDDGRLQLFESVAGLLCELASSGPLLLVLEDLHWADRSSRDLLRYLLARLVDEPVAVVASYRSDDLHRRHPLRPLLAELVRLPVVERIELPPLDDTRSEERRVGNAR